MLGNANYTNVSCVDKYNYLKVSLTELKIYKTKLLYGATKSTQAKKKKNICMKI